MVMALCAGPYQAFAQSGAARSSEDRGLLKEPGAMQRAVALAEKYAPGGEPKDGFFLETGHLITGSGWVAAGPGYRHHVFGDRAVASGSAAVSWRLYTMAHGSLDTAPAGHHTWSYGVGALYQDALQINFFGLGNETLAAARSGYRLQSFDVDVHTTYTRGDVTLQARLGWLPMIDVRSMAGRVPAYPDVLDVFTEATAPGASAQRSFAHGDVSVTWDGRDRPGRPTRGGVYAARYSNYGDLDGGLYSFHGVQLEGTHYIPLGSPRWIAALHGWSAFTGTSEGRVVPFYLMPNVGGQSTIRGYRDYRFSGPQMVSVSAESRVALLTHVDAAVFVDAGRVADRVNQLGVSGFKHAVGVGVRVHTKMAALARLDVARSDDGWFAAFALTEPFTRKTFWGRLSPTVPFVP